RVGDVKELHFERTQFNDVLFLDRVQLRFFEQAVLPKLVLHQSHGEAAAINRNVQIRQDEWKRADVVFVTVRQQDCPDFTFIFETQSDIGNEDVDAQQLFVGEHHAGIDNNDGPRRAERHHVHAELSESA